MNTSLAFLARCLLATIFLVAGVRKAMAFPIVAAMMAGKGFPVSPVFLGASIALDIVGGLLLIANWNARLVAVALAVYTAVLAVVFHGFWNHFGDAPPVYNNEVNHFLKNIAIVGGLLLVAAQPAREQQA